MKNILRNNLWMMIVAWCLETRGYALPAIAVSAFSGFYLYMNNKDLNLFKTLTVALGFLVYCYLLASVTVSGLYDHFVLFIITVCADVGLTNEILQKERLSYLYRVFVFTFGTCLVFFLTTLFMPKPLISEVARINTLSLIMIIFVPYTSLMLLWLIRKEYQKKQLLDKIERIAKAKAYNIKA